MKINKHFAWMAATALVLSATSCVNDNSLSQTPQEEIDMTGVYGNGSKIITLSLNAESVIGTRADLPHISDGSKVDQLYFEVYEGEDQDALKEIKKQGSGDLTPYVTKQTVDVKEFPYTIKLSVDPEKYYRIALWAQRKYESADPFKVEDKPLNVTVSYTNAKNNDEFRDAFCASEIFAGSATTVKIILHRPFAQLNVGTTGADYINYMSGNIHPHKTVKYSKIVVKGVYDKIDVVNDEISKTTAIAENGVTFDFEKIPAFYNVETNTNITDDNLKELGGFPNEEFLIVKLNDPELAKIKWKESESEQSVAATNGFFGFKTSYPTIKAKDEVIEPTETEKEVYYLTETFRYLSMSYVLVKSDKDLNDWGGIENGNYRNKYDIYKSSTLDEVDIWFANAEDDADAHKYFTVKNVPVHRNWRTNLLGGLADPTDPDNPDDSSSLFYNTKIAVFLCPNYFGEFNGSSDKDNPNHYEGIFGGWFPTNDDDPFHNGHNTSGED